jgi:glycosyltransferase involved in cell wall biosynthesis
MPETRIQDAVVSPPGLPKISVVMPSFNQARFIERSLLSVLDQHYPNLELIVIDGGSSDGTVDIIRKYESRLAYWISEPDKGQSDALNRGFARASGEIYGWLNSDDLYMPMALHRVAEALLRNSGKSIVYGDWLTIDANDRVFEHEFAFDFNLNQFKYEGFHINAQAAFWRRDVHRRFGGFDPDLHRTMDYQMLLAFGINEGETAFLRIPEALGCFRRHEDQKTQGFGAQVADEHRRLAERYGYADKYAAKGAARRSTYRLRRAWWYLRRGGLGYVLKKLRGEATTRESSINSGPGVP